MSYLLATIISSLVYILFLRSFIYYIISNQPKKDVDYLKQRFKKK